MKAPSISTIVGVAAGVALAVYLLNRFTDDGLTMFGKQAPATGGR